MQYYQKLQVDFPWLRSVPTKRSESWAGVGLSPGNCWQPLSFLRLSRSCHCRGVQVDVSTSFARSDLITRHMEYEVNSCRQSDVHTVMFDSTCPKPPPAERSSVPSARAHSWLRELLASLLRLRRRLFLGRDDDPRYLKSRGGQSTEQPHVPPPSVEHQPTQWESGRPGPRDGWAQRSQNCPRPILSPVSSMVSSPSRDQSESSG